MRVGYRFGLAGRRSSCSARSSTSPNRVNFAKPDGNQAVGASFLVFTDYSTSYTPRKLQNRRGGSSS